MSDEKDDGKIDDGAATGYPEDYFENDTEDEHAVFVKEDGKANEDEDIGSWDWKQLKAAVWGGAALSSDELWQEAWERVNPATLYSASNIFAHVGGTLRAVGENLRAQAYAVAGEDGSWKGPAAAEFLAKMRTLSAAIEANADRLVGPAANPIKDQLWDNARWLEWARDATERIDHHYARLVKLRNPDLVMDNGLVMVSKDKEVKEALDKSMLEVIKALSGQYGSFKEGEVTYDSPFTPELKGPGPDPGPDDKPDSPPWDDWGDPPWSDWKPPPVTDPPPIDQPDVKDPPPIDQPDVKDPPPIDQPDVKDLPPVGGPGVTDPPPVGAAITDPPPVGGPGVTDPPPVGGPPVGGPPVGGPPDIKQPPPIKQPDIKQPPPVDQPDIKQPPPVEQPKIEQPPGSTPPPVVPPGNIPTPPPVVPPGNVPKPPVVPPGNVPKPPVVPPGNIPKPPGGQNGGGSNLPEMPGGGTVPPPGEIGTPPPIGEAPPVSEPQQWSPPGGEGGQGGNQDRGMPMMPPMMPPGAGGGQGQGAERPDASGLLDAGDKPWSSGGLPGFGEPTAPGGAVPGGPGLETPFQENPQQWSPPGAEGGQGGNQDRGMPMMPPMMPPGAGGGQGQGAERPDASGLLEAGERTWESSGPDVGEPTAPEGAVPGGPGLGVPLTTNPQEWSPSGGEGSPDEQNRGMPMMPPMMPPGAGAGPGRTEERPDAAGLLEAGNKPWETSGPDIGEPDAPRGAVAGGAEPVAETPVVADSVDWGRPLDVDQLGVSGDVEPVAETSDVADSVDWGRPSDVDQLGVSGDVEPVAETPVVADSVDWGRPSDAVLPPVGDVPVDHVQPPVVAPVMPPVAGGAEQQVELAPESPDAGAEPWEPADPTPDEPEAVSAEPDATGEPVPETADSAEAVAESGETDSAEPDEDHVPIVRPDEEEDTSAWDVPGGGLPWLVPFPAAAPGDDREADRRGPDYALRDSAPWQGDEESDSGYTTWRNTNWAEKSAIPAEAKPLRCGGPNDVQLERMEAEERAKAEAEAAEEAAKAEEAEEEEKERSSADLLVRDNSAWGGGPAAPPSGVIG